jgi:hypothetical protein
MQCSLLEFINREYYYGTCKINRLPTEIIMMILDYVYEDAITGANIRMVCRWWNTIALDISEDRSSVDIANIFANTKIKKLRKIKSIISCINKLDQDSAGKLYSILLINNQHDSIKIMKKKFIEKNLSNIKEHYADITGAEKRFLDHFIKMCRHGATKLSKNVIEIYGRELIRSGHENKRIECICGDGRIRGDINENEFRGVFQSYFSYKTEELSHEFCKGFIYTIFKIVK